MTIFALQAKKCPKLAFYGVLGEFCTGVAREEVCRASFVPVWPVRRCAGRVLSLRRPGVMTLEVGVNWLGVQ